MKKNLLLTCLLTLIAALGMAQTKATFPITLTEAEGLPGPFVVQNYLFKSDVYEMDKPVQKIRFTVCNTNTANNVGTGSHDGISAYNGPGQPFFTMSEVRFFDENGNSVEYVANANSIDPGDGGGLAALSDNNEGTYLHTNYGGRVLEMPMEYHYVEFELEKEVSTFSFTIQTRSKYYKNLITYMGVTGGSIDASEEELAYVPYPEQEFQLGKKVTSLKDFEKEGSFFVFQASAQDYTHTYEYTISGEPYVVEYTIPGNMYMRSPYESAITPSAANVAYLVPDADGTPDTYRVCWLNSGRYIYKHTGGLDIWTSWTRDLSQAAALSFEPCDTADGFYLTVPGTATVDGEARKFTAYLGYDCLGRMDYIADSDSAFEKTARPHSYNWTIYNASIKGSAITATLQAEIDKAEARIEAVGGKVPGDYDDGEYDDLMAALKVAKRMVANPEVSAGDIVSMAADIRSLTTAYAIVGLWAYADTINKIEEMVDAEEITVVEIPNWTPGAYLDQSVYALLDYMGEIQDVVEACETLADVDNAVAKLYEKVDAFWASKLPEDLKMTELPFRIGQPEDGLPGEHVNSEYIWHSKTYYFAEEVESMRMTVFKTKSGRTDSYGKPFICVNEIAFYDAAGNYIPMTEECYVPTSCATNDGAGIAGLCNGTHGTNAGTHFHSSWGSDNGGEFFALDIYFPEPVYGFSYKQWGRGNGYDDLPIDFLFGFEGEVAIPEDYPFPAKEDPYGAVLGDVVTSVDEITDEGFYAIVGNWNAAPEGTGSSNPIFYSGINCYGPVYEGAGSPCVYKITKSIDNDSTYNIFSYANNRYLMNNGEGGNYYTGTTDSVKYAANVRIVPSAPLREELGAEEFENAFFIYQFKDTIVKEVDEYDEDLDTTLKVKKPHPYLYLDSWGGEGSGRFVWRAMYGPGEYAETNNDGNLKYFMGELEWKIYKMTIEKPNLYWLQAIYNEAAQNEMFVGTNPGYYTEGSVGAFANALAQAQAALDSNDDAVAAAAIEALQTTLHLPSTAERNPVIAGTYVIESAMPEYLAQQGSPKVLCSYFNRWTVWGDDGYSASSDYTMWWTYAPEDYFDCHARYQFELIPAVITEDAPEGTIYSELLAQWYADSVVTDEQLAAAFFIKSVEIGQYVYVPEIYNEDGVTPQNSRDFGFTETPETPYVFLEQGAYKFNIWSPFAPNKCFHLLDHGNGGGTASSVCHWNGDGVAASQFKLYRISEDPNGINNVADAQGEVVSVSYYTVDGAAIAAPVKGINVVKKTYANGVVKTTKEFVK